MVVPSFSRIHFSLDVHSFSFSLIQFAASFLIPTHVRLDRKDRYLCLWMSTCLQTYVDIKHYHAYLVRTALYVRTETCTCLFSSGKGNAKERREASLSLSLSLLSFVIVVRAEFSDGSYLDSIISRILRIENIMPIVGGISFFKFEVSSFFFFFPIYTTRSRETFSFPRSYFKSFHIVVIVSTTHVHIRSMSYTARAICI